MSIVKDALKANGGSAGVHLHEVNNLDNARSVVSEVVKLTGELHGAFNNAGSNSHICI